MNNIFFKGVKFEKDFAVLIFENSEHRTVDIPIDLLSARRILDMLKHIKAPDAKFVEIGNDEESD